MFRSLPPMLLLMASAPLHAQALDPAPAMGATALLHMGLAHARETMLGFGKDRSQPGIILLSDETGAEPRPIEHAHGFERLVIRVANLSATVAQLRAAGFTAGDVRDVARGYRMSMATDPDGYKLELVERTGAQEKTR
jgi:catechol 2,3-dioxygenase-like lactoylglutathione lyase family enzyme